MKLTCGFMSLLVALSISACGNDNNAKPKLPAGDGGEKTSKVQPLSYSTNLDVMATGDLVKESSFKLPIQAKDGQSVTVSFEFNSKGATKMKVIRQMQAAPCFGGTGDVKHQLVKKGDESKVVYEDMNVVSDYTIEPETDYAYEVVSSSSNCSTFETGLAVWVGDSFVEPERVIHCKYGSATHGGFSFYYFPQQNPTTAFASFDQKMFGYNLLCGKEVKSNEQHYSKNMKTGSVKALLKIEGGTEHSFEMLFSEDLKSGELTCMKDGVEFGAAILRECQEKVLNKADFQFDD